MAELALKEAQVICSGVSYFEVIEVKDATGQQRVDPVTKNPVFSEVRRTARLGQVVELTEAEYERLDKLDAVQEPGAAPLPGSPGARVYATPFGVPLPDPDDPNKQVSWQGPIMGDPRPAGATLTDTELLSGDRGGALTAEDALAAATGTISEDDNAALRSSYEELGKSDLEDEAKDRGLEVEGSGSGGNVTKKDLVTALVEDDLKDEPTATPDSEGAEG